MKVKRKTESFTRPPLFDISISDDIATIRFAENVTEKVIEATEDEGEQKVYEYDSYTLKIKKRADFESDITSNYDSWLAKAKQIEHDELAAEIRAKRDALLAETDKEFVLDRINLNDLSGLSNNPMARYRQALRDIPEQEGFPYNVRFPNKPK